MAGNTFILMSVFALAAMTVNLAGIWAIYKNEEWAQKNKGYFMCFAAGVLISSPLIMALPEAIERSKNAGLMALAGFMFMFVSNRLIKQTTHEKALAFGIIALEGIGIHSFIDGIVYAVTFGASAFAGVMAGIGLVVHEFAEGVITFSVLVEGGMEKKKAFLYAFLVAGLTTPLGAFLAFPLVNHLSSMLLGNALGFVAGVLIYISASHLLPEAGIYEKSHSHIAFLAGIALSLGMMFLE